MTICKKLAQGQKDNFDITAWKMQDKYCANEYYTISISDPKTGIAFEEIKTAKTTWQKKFNELIK